MFEIENAALTGPMAFDKFEIEPKELDAVALTCK
jgi:hypothetical protein